MTQGSPLKLVLALALPILLTNFGQQFYQIADAAIIGRGVGVRALAAVGSADWSYWLVLWGVLGLTQGFSIFVAQYYGRKDFVRMNKAIAMSTILSAIIGCALTLVGTFFARPLLVLLGTPADILSDAAVYLEVMIAGTAAITAYNMAASVLRAFGDGRTPSLGDGHRGGREHRARSPVRLRVPLGRVRCRDRVRHRPGGLVRLLPSSDRARVLRASGCRGLASGPDDDR